MFAECASYHDMGITRTKQLKATKPDHELKIVPVKEKLTVKQFADNVFSALSTSCQSIGSKLKETLIPKRKESAAEKRARVLQEKLNHLLDLEAVTLNEYVP